MTYSRTPADPAALQRPCVDGHTGCRKAAGPGAAPQPQPTPNSERSGRSASACRARPGSPFATRKARTHSEPKTRSQAGSANGVGSPQTKLRARMAAKGLNSTTAKKRLKDRDMDATDCSLHSEAVSANPSRCSRHRPGSPLKAWAKAPCIGGSAPRFKDPAPRGYSHEEAPLYSSFRTDKGSNKGTAGFCPPHKARYEMSLPHNKYPQPGPGEYTPSPFSDSLFPKARDRAAMDTQSKQTTAGAKKRPYGMGNAARFPKSEQTPGPGSYEKPQDGPTSHLKAQNKILGGDLKSRPAAGTVAQGVFIGSTVGYDHQSGPGTYNTSISCFDYVAGVHTKRSHNAYYVAETCRRHQEILSARTFSRCSSPHRAQTARAFSSTRSLSAGAAGSTKDEPPRAATPQAERPPSPVEGHAALTKGSATEEAPPSPAPAPQGWPPHPGTRAVAWA